MFIPLAATVQIILIFVTGLLSVGVTNAQLMVMPTPPPSRNLSIIPQANIPSDCQSQCSEDTLFAVTNCTVAKCVCSNDTSDSIRTCTDCLVNLNTLDPDVQQAVFAGYESSCRSLSAEVKQQFDNSAVIRPIYLGMMGTLLGAALVSMLL